MGKKQAQNYGNLDAQSSPETDDRLAQIAGSNADAARRSFAALLWAVNKKEQK